MLLPVFQRVVLFFRRIGFLVSFPVIADLAAGTGRQSSDFSDIGNFFSKPWKIGLSALRFMVKSSLNQFPKQELS
jgi:hypothetical protein